MNKNLFILFGVCFIFIACELTPAAHLKKFSDDLNKKCPIDFSSNSILDSTSYIKSSNEFNYYYTLINVDPKSILNNKTKLEKSIPLAVAENPEMNYFRKHHVMLNYRYYLKKDRCFLFQVRVEN